MQILIQLVFAYTCTRGYSYISQWIAASPSLFRMIINNEKVSK